MGAQIASLLLGRKASLFNIAGHVVGYAAVDSVHRVKELADGLVVVKSVDDQSNVFAHVAGDIVVFGKKLRGLVDQVSGEQLVEDAIFVGFVEFFQAIGEETKGGTDIDSTCTSFFEERGNFKYCISGGNHIIDENHVFAFKVWSKEFVGSDWMTAIYSFGVIKTLVVHSHVYSQDIGQIDGTVHASFIRADDHEVVIVNVKTVFVV